MIIAIIEDLQSKNDRVYLGSAGQELMIITIIEDLQSKKVSFKHM